MKTVKIPNWLIQSIGQILYGFFSSIASRGQAFLRWKKKKLGVSDKIYCGLGLFFTTNDRRQNFNFTLSLKVGKASVSDYCHMF